jgi:hypothetical protein
MLVTFPTFSQMLQQPTRVYSELSGLCPSPGILNAKNITFRKLDLFASSGEGRETPTLLGPLALSGD